MIPKKGLIGCALPVSTSGSVNCICVWDLVAQKGCWAIALSEESSQMRGASRPSECWVQDPWCVTCSACDQSSLTRVAQGAHGFVPGRQLFLDAETTGKWHFLLLCLLSHLASCPLSPTFSSYSAISGPVLLCPVLRRRAGWKGLEKLWS